MRDENQLSGCPRACSPASCFLSASIRLFPTSPWSPVPLNHPAQGKGPTRFSWNLWQMKELNGSLLPGGAEVGAILVEEAPRGPCPTH